MLLPPPTPPLAAYCANKAHSGKSHQRRNPVRPRQALARRAESSRAERGERAKRGTTAGHQQHWQTAGRGRWSDRSTTMRKREPNSRRKACLKPLQTKDSTHIWNIVWGLLLLSARQDGQNGHQRPAVPMGGQRSSHRIFEHMGVIPYERGKASSSSPSPALGVTWSESAVRVGMQERRQSETASKFW